MPRLSTEPAGLAEFTRRLHASARRVALLWAGLAGMAMAFGWFRAGPEMYLRQTSNAAVDVVLAALFGLFIGRAITYGRLAGRLRRAGIAVIVKAQYPDSAGGLRPLGDLYWFQASIFAMAAAYFGAQWIFAPLIGYEVWRAPLALLIGFLVIFEVLALLVPMWSFHEILLAFQQQELARADRIGTQIDGLQQQICDHPGPETAKSLREQITELTAQYAAIEALPKWPIPARGRRRFAIRNLVLLLPVSPRSLAPRSPGTTFSTSSAGLCQADLEHVQKVLTPRQH